MDRYAVRDKLKLPEKLNALRQKYIEAGIPSIKSPSLNELILHVSVKDPAKILEIGTAAGVSGIAMLTVCPDAKLVTVEKDETLFNEAERNFAAFGLSERATLRLGDAGDFLNYTDAKFDFIFLDGAKSRYIDYLPDIKRVLNERGVLFADNVLFRGYVDGGVPYTRGDNAIVNNLRRFLDAVISDEDFLSSVYEIGDGILIAQKL